MESAQIVAIAVLLISAGASFFFALAETALFSLSKWQMRQLSEREPRFGSIIGQLLADPQDLLATMVLGNTFATAGMLAIGFWMALRSHWPLVDTIVGLFVLILFGCEVLPKTLAVRSPEDWALRVSGPLLVLEKLALPLRLSAQKLNGLLLSGLPNRVRPIAAVADEEYQDLLDLAYQQGTLGQSEKEII